MGVCDKSVSVIIIHINRVPVEGNISVCVCDVFEI